MKRLVLVVLLLTALFASASEPDYYVEHQANGYARIVNKGPVRILCWVSYYDSSYTNFYVPRYSYSHWFPAINVVELACY